MNLVGNSIKSVINCTSFEHNPDSYRDASLKLALSTDCKLTNLDDKEDIYNSKGRKESNYDVMHETMHFFGFDDRYNEKTKKPDQGYENDIMGKRRKYDLSPNHYANMYEFSIKQPEIQQDIYLKKIYNWLPLPAYRNNYTKQVIGDKMIDKR